MYHREQHHQDTLFRTLDSCLSDRSFTVDGKEVRFRLLRKEDMDLWTDFVNRCSRQSLWLRFLVPFSATPERAQRFCDINPDKEFAIIAEMIDGDDRKVIGISRLIKLPHNNEAELALIVSDPWQRRALGQMLSEMTVGMAKQWGVKSVFSETMMENRAMIKVLKRCQFKVEERNGNMFTLSLKLA
jgi:acetyltransferase